MNLKKLKVQGLRPYQRIEEGYSIDALVAYGKRPYFNSVTLGVVQWEHILFINLWIIRLTLDWVGKLKEPNDK